MRPAELKGVRKRYGKVEALRGLDLVLERGEGLALLGPNGAGKTTTLHLLAGLLTPDAGEVRLFGQDPTRPEARRRLGLTPQEAAFPERLRVVEVLALAAAHYPHPRPLGEVLETFGLEGLAYRFAGALSGGERRRLALALAFVGGPELVILDEPTTGLDLEARRRVWEAVRAHRARGGSFLLATHHPEEAEALADRILVLHRGRAVAEGSPRAIRERVGVKRVRFAAPYLPPGFSEALKEGDRYTLLTPRPEEAVRALVLSGVPFADLEVTPLSLEEALLALFREVAA